MKIFILFIILFTSINATYLSEANLAYKQGDIKKAIKLYKLAIIDGDNQSYFNLAMIYYKQKDLDKAMYYFKMASMYDNKKATFNMATIFAQKKYSKHSFKKSFDIFNKLAQQDYPKAQHKVGLFLLYGIGGISKDYGLALRWFEQAFFNHNYLQSGCYLAYMYVNGYGVFPNFGRARKLAIKGYKKHYPMCVKVYKEYKLYKYKEDKGFKFGYYKDL